MSYYYLVASLPLLDMDKEPPFTSADFVHSCEGILSETDQETLERIAVDPLEAAGSGAAAGNEGHAFLHQWAARDTQLRNALARGRAARTRADASQWLWPDTDFDSLTAAAADTALSQDQPLQRERDLDRHRWRILREMAEEDPYGASPVFAFLLQLRIVERWRQINPEAGLNRLESLLTELLQPARSDSDGS